jgi:hypothetical protein
MLRALGDAESFREQLLSQAEHTNRRGSTRSRAIEMSRDVSAFEFDSNATYAIDLA